jgi:Uma2 family endonuclease
MFATRLNGRGTVSVQNPILLQPKNAPQPDLVIIRPTRANPRELPGAEDVLLVIEVAHTTLDYDRDVKIPIYARHGIPESWLFDVKGKELSIFQDPGPNGYALTLRPSNSETVSPLQLLDVTIELADVW